jgi:hypothetical protein
MKAAAAIAAAVALALVVAGAHALTPGDARIRITGARIETREFGAFTMRTYALYNRPAYPGRLGTATVSCLEVAGGMLDCSELLRLSRGTIITRGYVPKAAAYRVLAVVGGTGLYDNVGGEMTTQPLGGGQLLLINLIAY